MKPAKWLFFDIGSTLIDETEALAHRIRDTSEGSGVSVEAFTRTAEAYYAQGLDGYKAALCEYHLSKASWRPEDELPFCDAASTLHALKERGYRLGIVANQLPGTKQRLRQWRILPYFDVIAASDECGFSKPDPGIFLFALREAGCEPADAVMIGDRVDNDLIPAKALGMQTVRILSGPFSVSPSPEGAADATVLSLSALLDLFPSPGTDHRVVTDSASASAMPK